MQTKKPYFFMEKKKRAKADEKLILLNPPYIFYMDYMLTLVLVVSSGKMARHLAL